MALDDYEKKRDFAQTPEPGSAVRSSEGGNAFVIQKHAARRLHYDFRLELDGVLKSWAVPKGPSLDPAEKHLAVHVEDHPLEYASFEGTIPKGQYGGGTVMVWDRGRWFAEGEAAVDPVAAYRKGKLKFRLEGEKLRGRWMLLRLAHRPGEDQDNWLLFKERDEQTRCGHEAAITVVQPDSVITGRSLEQIAAGESRLGDPGGEGQREQLPAEQAAASESSPNEDGAERPAAADIPGARAAAAPALVAPELATLVAQSPSGDDWLHEIKFDGYRIMCRLEEGGARLLTRRGVDWTSRFPTLLGSIRSVPARSAILDGEVVFMGQDGRTSFSQLARALQSGTDAGGGIVYYVFDLLYLDGQDLTRVPLQRRKEVLRQLLKGFTAGDRVRYVQHLQGSGEDFFAQSCEFALEGEVAKRRDSPYRPGRGRDWLKVKCTRRQEFVIVGFTDRAGGRGGLGALLLGLRREPGGTLSCAGRVGTGWDDQTMTELRGRLDGLRQTESACVDPPRGKDFAGIHWVRPQLVAEIEYLSWNGRGFRHASFEGLRLDKSALEVVAESPQTQVLQAYSPPAGALSPPGDEAAGGPTSASPGRTRKDLRGDRWVIVGGVSISNPDRVVYEELGLTKLELARYYEDIAPWMLPHVSRRPLTLVRCPEGRAKECFYQKHVAARFPEAVLRVPIEEQGGVATYAAIDSTAGLLSLVQMGVLEFHVWGSHAENVENPDQIVFDLDPDTQLPFARVADAACLVRDVLAGLGLRSFVKTTGGKGLHVVAPILPTRAWDEVKPFTKAVAEVLVRLDPSAYTTSMALSRRVGKIYIDYLRNGRGATSVCAFSTRRRPGGTVSVPLRWDELGARMRADRYTVGNVRRRISQLREDPWRDYGELRQEITPEMLAAAADWSPEHA